MNHNTGTTHEPFRRTSVAASAVVAVVVAVVVFAWLAPSAALAAPADPVTTVTTVTAVTTGDSATTIGEVPVPTTAPTTAVVIADVATGAPPIVPQLASQSIVRGPTAASLAVPAAVPLLPVTGTRSAGLALEAFAILVAGSLAAVLARRRPAT